MPGKVVPYVRGGVGAFCTQHWHNPKYGDRALDLLAAGKPPEEVLTELLTFYSEGTPHTRRQAALYARSVLANPLVVVLPQTHHSFLEGVRLYESRLDKAYSLTDCISMETMRREGLTDVLTNDHHFTQEGFHILFP